MKARWACSGLLVSAALQLGCDARAGSDYEGESLLSIEGSVVIDRDTAPSELVPAIAFRDAKQNLHVLDVEVRGRFPANFRLDVLDRPPPEAFYEPADYFPVVTPDEPRFALAYIAAVSADHPERIALATETYEFRCENGAGITPPADLSMFDPSEPGVHGQPGTPCTRETRACTQDESACYVKLERCDNVFQNCEVISLSGDPELLKTTSVEHFAGLSSNYLLVYLEQRAAAGSTLAMMFGGGKKLRAGYHLLEVRDFSEAEMEDDRACWEHAEALAFPRFNAAHGTNYSQTERPSPEDGLEFSRVVFAAGMELDCALAPYSIEPVERLRHRKISIVVGPGKAPPYLLD